ncbi:hypothetical protein PENSPDRAFT_654746 [Peniophora sp. CONT]|nr:hypothetical protein PENSPDRAFT_654746 [Peniophora sp. CONT]
MAEQQQQQQQHVASVATPREYELSVRQQPKQARMCGVGGVFMFRSHSRASVC